MGRMIRVSVVIPAYDREGVLSATLESVEKQIFANWEAIVVDDGSRDRTLELALEFSRRDPRFHAFPRQAPLKGANVCRNEGLAKAQGDYIIFLDSDNLLHPNSLGPRVAAMDAAPDCQFGVYQTEVFDEQIGDRQLLCNAFDDSDDLLRMLSFDPVWHTTGPIWRADAIRALRGFDPELASFQEWDLHVRALVGRPKYFKVSTRDHYYRMGGKNENRLGRLSTTHPDHLKSHERLFEKTVAFLRKSGRMEEPIRCRMVGAFWWLATRYRVVINAAESCRLWRKAYELGLIGRRHLFEGLLAIQMARVRGGRHLGRPIQAFWPRQYYQYYSATSMRTPVNSLDGKVYWSR